MSFRIHNTGSQLLIESVSSHNLNYYDKTNLTVNASNGKVVITNTIGELVTIIFSQEPANIDLPSFNGLYDLITTIHSWIISGVSSSNTDIKRVSYVLTPAQVLALNSTPIVLVAGVVGKELQVMSAAMRIKFASAAYAANTILTLGTATNPDGQARLDCLAAVADIKGTMELLTTGTVANLHTGENLVMSVASGNPTTGDSQVVVDITYREIDL